MLPIHSTRSRFTATLVIVIAATASSGCLADAGARQRGADCRCLFTVGDLDYDLPCGVQACTNSVAVECVSPTEVTVLEAECRSELDVRSGRCWGGRADSCGLASPLDPLSCPTYCEIDCVGGLCYCQSRGRPTPDCEDLVGEYACELGGCIWEPAECSYSAEGCEGAFEPTAAL